MKRTWYIILFLLIISGCVKKENSYEDFQLAVEDQDIIKLNNLLHSQNSLSTDEMNELAYQSLSKYKNFEMAEAFYENGLDINAVFCHIDLTNITNSKLEKTNILYYAIKSNSIEMYQYAKSKNVNFDRNCYEFGNEKIKPILLAAKNKSALLDYMIKDINTTNIADINLESALYYIETEKEINALLSRQDIVDYFYKSPEFADFVSSYYGTERLKEYSNKMDFSKLTFSDDINYFNSALSSENKLETIKWLMENNLNPNLKRFYDGDPNSQLTVKEAAWEYANRIRRSYDVQGEIYENIKKDAVWLSFQSVIKYLESSSFKVTE